MNNKGRVRNGYDTKKKTNDFAGFGVPYEKLTDRGQCLVTIYLNSGNALINLIEILLFQINRQNDYSDSLRESKRGMGPFSSRKSRSASSCFKQSIAHLLIASLESF